MDSSLRSLLSYVDGTAPSIQAAAGAMMKYYDRSAGVAVVEWRNSLHNAHIDKHLSLLYVANEVLQNSKRNRGNKFLEAFSPVLGQSLAFICQQDRNNAGKIERVRRTVKIWGDRQVFSRRYVTELIRGLETFRNGSAAAAVPSPSSTVAAAPSAADNSNILNYQNHRLHTSVMNTSSAAISNKASSTPTLASPSSPLGTPFSPAPGSEQPTASPKPTNNDEEDDDDDDPMAILNQDATNMHDDDSDDDDDGNVFGNNSASKLQVDISFDAPNSSSSATKKGSGMKRRRSSASAGSGGGSSKKSRKKAILSTTSLMDLWKQVSDLQQNFDNSQLMSQKIIEWTNSDEAKNKLDTLVGEELLTTFKKVFDYQDQLLAERRMIHTIANERKSLENDVLRYLPWLEASLKQDEEDIKFCNSLEKQLSTLKKIHGPIRMARDKRLQEEIQHSKLIEEQEKKRREEEEQRRFREAALRSETVAQPGMIWNPNTREYQYLNTDESWRD